MFDLTVSDDDGGVIDGDGEDGSITIGDVVILSATSDTGDVSEEVNVDINLQNSGIVGGVQFDMYDTPDYLGCDRIFNHRSFQWIYSGV